VILRVLPDFIALALLIYCLIDCIQSPEGEIRNLPRWGWLILVILLPIVGPVAWLVAGRPLRTGQQRGVPWPSRTAGYPERERPARGPDDDAEFLSGIKRADDEHQDVLRKWEDDLRRREQQLKDSGDTAPEPDEGTRSS
jgi:Phospholipase_D-nuclease N-terminal